MSAYMDYGSGFVRPPATMQFAGPTAKSSAILARAVVRWNPSNLAYMSTDFRADGDLVCIAMQSPFGLFQATPEKPSIQLLQSVSRELRSNEDFVLEAVKRSGWELQWASETLKDNQSIIAWACAPLVLKMLPKHEVERICAKLALDQLAHQDSLLQVDIEKQNVTRLQMLKSNSVPQMHGFNINLEYKRAQERLAAAEDRELKSRFVADGHYHTGAELELHVIDGPMRQLLWPRPVQCNQVSIV